MTQVVGTGYCAFCSDPVDKENPDVYKETSVWVGGEKSNLSMMRVYTGNYACPNCVKAIKEKQPPGEATLFDDTEPPVSLVEWNPGFEAGWRGDEIIAEHSRDWKIGYEAGVNARENIG